MLSLINKDTDVWKRPWDIEKFDNLHYKDERFFSILTKGFLLWLNENILMYGKSIPHFILHTGSAYMYLEKNGYEYDWCETNGENYIYMQSPRCIVTLGTISIPTEELTAYGIMCQYERNSSKKEGQTIACNAMMKRIPIELEVECKYVFSTFNESIIFVQELLENIAFQRYFKIVYLGQTIECSIEFSQNAKIDFRNIDMTSKDPNQKTVDVSLKICTNLPAIDARSESLSSNVIHKPLYGINDIKTGEIYGEYEVGK